MIYEHELTGGKRRPELGLVVKLATNCKMILKITGYSNIVRHAAWFIQNFYDPDSCKEAEIPPIEWNKEAKRSPGINLWKQTVRAWMCTEIHQLTTKRSRSWSGKTSLKSWCSAPDVICQSWINTYWKFWIVCGIQNVCSATNASVFWPRNATQEKENYIVLKIFIGLLRFQLLVELFADI